jgi:hypothetical protein
MFVRRDRGSKDLAQQIYFDLVLHQHRNPTDTLAPMVTHLAERSPAGRKALSSHNASAERAMSPPAGEPHLAIGRRSLASHGFV